jgi:hypothetical protein
MSKDIRSWLLDTWPGCKAETTPFPYWVPEHALPPAAARALAALDVDAPRIGDTQGKRETHNATRWFFSPEHRKALPPCNALATAFQNPDVVGMLQSLTGATLPGTSLRIEYCQDRSGFWLEPHTDIGAKRFTVLIYLTDSPDGKSLGTDLYDSEKQYLGHAPGDFNSGLIFVPGANTWHGFRRRVFDGVRTSIIINYVGTEWRARHELAFPDSPVTAS